MQRILQNPSCLLWFREACLILLAVEIFGTFSTSKASAAEKGHNSWSDRMLRFQEDSGAILVTDQKADKILTFAKMLNECIMKKKISCLLQNMATDDFRDYGVPGPSIEPDNIVQNIRKQFRDKKGDDYNYIFDIEKYVRTGQDIRERPVKESLAYAGNFDIRKYLIHHKNDLKWRVFYLDQATYYLPGKTYVVFFSFPDDIISFHFNFQYFIAERSRKLIWVGF